MTIEVYTFEDEGGNSQDWSTQDSKQAKRYGRQRGFKVIANTYEFSDSELVWDFTSKED